MLRPDYLPTSQQHHVFEGSSPLGGSCRNRKAHHLALRPSQPRNKPFEQWSQHQDRSQHPRPQRRRLHREIHPRRRFPKQAAIDSLPPLDI